MANVPVPTLDTEVTQAWGAAVAGRLSTGCLAWATGTTQSVATGLGSLTEVSFSSGQFVSDPGAWNDHANNRIIVPEAGVYLLWGYAKFADDSTGGRRAALRVSGTNIVEQLWDATVTAQPLGMPLMGVQLLSAGQNITLAVAQSSGGALNVITKGLAAWRLW